MPADREVLTFEEVADRLRCSVRFVQLEVKRGRLVVTKIGARRRVTPDELARYIAANTERNERPAMPRRVGKLPPVPTYV